MQYKGFLKIMVDSQDSHTKKGFFARLFDKKKTSQKTDKQETRQEKIIPSSPAEEEKTVSSAPSAPAPASSDKALLSEKTTENGDDSQETDGYRESTDIPQEIEEAKPTKPVLSWFARLKQGMSRSSQAFSSGLSSLLGGKKLDADTLQDLEDLLIQADLGIETSVSVINKISKERYEDLEEKDVRKIVCQELESVLEGAEKPFPLESYDLNANGMDNAPPRPSPYVIVFAGVNGTGKTSTIGKLAARLYDKGQKVLLAAGDTFRAAAIEQLEIWGKRANAPVVVRPQGSDPAGLVFDAMKIAQKEGYDVLLIDTAGRLQNKAELMAELEKIIRVIKKHDLTAPHDVILTLDATTGQNALSQVALFKKTADITGLVVTKLDGSARGGILVPITKQHHLPIYFIGVGEQKEDLAPFSAADFAKALVGLDQEER